MLTRREPVSEQKAAWVQGPGRSPSGSGARGGCDCRSWTLLAASKSKRELDGHTVGPDARRSEHVDDFQLDRDRIGRVEFDAEHWAVQALNLAAEIGVGYRDLDVLVSEVRAVLLHAFGDLRVEGLSR